MTTYEQLRVKRNGVRIAEVLADSDDIGFTVDPETGKISASFSEAASANLAKVIRPTLNDASQAAANTALLQASIDAGGVMRWDGSGVAYTNAPLVVGSNTKVFISPTLTIRQAPGINSNLIHSAVYAQILAGAAAATVTLTWASGMTCSVAWTAHPFSVGDFAWIEGTGGTTDSAFTGVFPVATVTDANNFVVYLKRQPSATPSGAVTGRKCDTNSSIEGGIWDYNVTDNNSASQQQTHIASLVGMQDCHFKDMIGTNTKKFFFAAGALRDCSFKQIQSRIGSSGRSASDIVHIFGPSFGIVIDEIYGDPGSDDGISLQPVCPDQFIAYEITGGGDIIGVTVRNVDIQHCATSGVRTYSHPNWVMDAIVFDKIYAYCPAGSTVRIGVDVATGGIIKSIKIKNIQWSNVGDNALGAVHVDGNSGSQIIDRLEIDGVTASSPVTLSTACGVYLGAGATIQHAIIKGVRTTIGINSFAVTLDGAIVSNLVIDGCEMIATSQVGYILNLLTGTVSKITLKNNLGSNLTGAIVAQATMTGISQVTLRDNDLPSCSAGVNALTGMQISVGNNFFNGTVTNGFIRITGSIVIGVHSAGGNVGIPAAKWIVVGSGSPTITMGRALDFKIDASIAARADAELFYNTNSALGTLGVAGLIVGQGTATGSRHLMTDPTKVV